MRDAIEPAEHADLRYVDGADRHTLGSNADSIELVLDVAGGGARAVAVLRARTDVGDRFDVRHHAIDIETRAWLARRARSDDQQR